MKNFLILISILAAISLAIFGAVKVEKCLAESATDRGLCSLCHTPYQFDKVVRDKETDFYFYICPNCGNSVHLYFPLEKSDLN